MGTEASQLTNVSFSEPTRRDLLFVATSATGAVAAAATLVPLIEQMNPDASTLAAGARLSSISAKWSLADMSLCSGGRGQSSWSFVRPKC